MNTFEAAVLFPYRGNKFLLQHRSAQVPRWPGYWSSFGGGIEAGETLEEALAREMREELGYTVQNPRPVFFQPIENGGKHIFIEAWSGSEPHTLDPRESVDHRWFTIGEAQQLMLIPHDLEALEKIAHLLQQ